jgi:hypothetical protein
MKQILTKRGEVKKITELIGCSRGTVISALHGRYDTVLSKKIRAIAIRRGGVESR